MLVSETGFGKSHWARSLGPHIYFRNVYNMDKAIAANAADYVVFDDINLEHVHAAKVWVSAQGEFDDTDKFRAKKTFSWGPRKCCIILCNAGNRWDQTEIWQKEADWWYNRVKTVILNNKLFI